MTPQELTQRLSDIEGILLQLMEKKPSRIRQIWNWMKPSLVPFILGMMVGILSAVVCGLPSAVFPPLTTKQAASGGAAIPPFSEWTQRNGNPLPSPSSMPQGNSKTELSGSSLRNISEPPLPVNPAVDDGQANFPRSFRRIPVRMR